MKKKLFIMIMSCLLYKNGIIAQTDKKFSASVDFFIERTNLHYIKFYGVRKDNLLYQTNYTTQAKLSYYLNNYFALTSGISYAKRGFDTENKTYTTNYIQIPAQIKYNIFDYRYFQLSPYIGGYIGIPISNHQKLQGVDFESNETNLDYGFEYGIIGLFPLNDQLKFSTTIRSQVGAGNVSNYNNYEKKGNIAYSFGIGIIKYFDKF